MLPSSSADASPDQERRHEHRHRIRPDVMCEVIDPLTQGVTEAGVWNISPDGVCLVVEPQFRPDECLELDCRTRPAEPRLHFFARVIHTLEVPSFRAAFLTGCSVQGDPLDEDVLTSAR
jgi:hypothetical protein